MAGANKPALPLGPPPGTFAGDQHRAIQRELEKLTLAMRQLREGRLFGLYALPAAPAGGQYAQGDIVRNSAPTRTISASATFVVWGWQYADEGAGTLTWAELRFWESMAAGGGGGLTFGSLTATHTGSGQTIYAGNSGTELVFRKLQAGTGISLTVSAGAVRITNTTAAGGFTGASMTATNTGTGVGVYVGNVAGELTFRKVQAGTGVSITTSGGAIRIASTVAAGGGNSITSTVVASTPSGTVAGTLFLPKDSVTIGRATGTGWERWGPIYPLSEVPDTGWTRLGFTASYSVVHEFGTAHFYSTPIESGVAATNNNQLYYERTRTSVSATWQITALFAGFWPAHAAGRFGIYIGDSAGNKYAEFVIATGTTGQQFWSHRNMSSITASLAPTFGLTITFAAVYDMPSLFGFRLQQIAGTNTRNFFLTHNGKDFVRVSSQSITSSASIPAAFDKVGVVFCSNNSTIATVNRNIRLVSWKEN